MVGTETSLEVVKREWAQQVSKILLNEVRPFLKGHPEREKAIKLSPDQIEFITWARCMGYITGRELRDALIRYFDKL